MEMQIISKLHMIIILIQFMQKKNIDKKEIKYQKHMHQLKYIINKFRMIQNQKKLKRKQLKLKMLLLNLKLIQLNMKIN